MDSSNNTPLHYAAASGFIECIELLIKHGADVHALNSWKITPIAIAMLNNHNGTVKRLLLEPNVDVNGKDEQGRTMLMMNMMDVSDPSCIDFTKFLLEKGADPIMSDLHGNTPLNLAAAHMFSYRNNNVKLSEDQERKTVLTLIDLLISHGVDINSKDKQGKTLLMLNMANISN